MLFSGQMIIYYNNPDDPNDEDRPDEGFWYNAGSTKIIGTLDPQYSASVSQIVVQCGQIEEIEDPALTILSAKIFKDVAPEPIEYKLNMTQYEKNYHIDATEFDGMYDDVEVRMHVRNITDPYETRANWGCGAIRPIDHYNTDDITQALTAKDGQEFDIYTTVGVFKEIAKNGTDAYDPAEPYHPAGGVTIQFWNDCELDAVYAQIPSNALKMVEGVDVADLKTNEYTDNQGYVAKQIYISDGYTYDNQQVILAKNIAYSRKYSNTEWWQAWHMPFSVSLEDMKPYLAQNETDQKYEIIEFLGVVEQDGESIAQFTLLEDAVETTVKANTPYLFIPVDTDIDYEFTNVELQPADPGKVAPKNSEYQFVGTYDVTQGLTTKGAYVVSAGAFKTTSSDNVKLKPFRAYLQPVNVSASSPQKINVRITDNNKTGISNIAVDALQGGQMYDLNGRPVSHPSRGIYILNGQKILIR